MTTREERLQAILEPSTTAVLTMELQNGVVGEGAMMRARSSTSSRGRARSTPCAGSATGARDAGARVVHCTVVARADGAGLHRELQDLRHVGEAAARAGLDRDRHRHVRAPS